ncbi:hypothetical protein D3C80_881810 [compost metagenome]
MDWLRPKVHAYRPLHGKPFVLDTLQSRVLIWPDSSLSQEREPSAQLNFAIHGQSNTAQTLTSQIVLKASADA